jgi:zinc protease
MTAGAAGRTGTQLSDAFGDLGSSLKFEVKPDYTVFTVDALTQQTGEVLTLLADLVARPTFDQHEFSRVRDEEVSALRASLAVPGTRAESVLRRQIYGSTSAYASPDIGTVETMMRLTRSDMVALYRRAWRPDQIAVVIVGDVSAERARTLADASFGSMPSVGDAVMPLQSAAQDHSRHVVTLVDVPAHQSRIAVGHLGVSQDLVERAAVNVMNQILGGGYGSRLNVILREERGYTYNVRSSFTDATAAGLFYVGGGIATDKVPAALQEIAAQIERIRAETPPSQELELAKTLECTLIGKQADSDDALATMLARTWGLRLPLDYWSQLMTQIRAVSAEDVTAAARRVLTPAKMQFVVVGPAAQLRGPLEGAALAPVETIQP